MTADARPGLVKAIVAVEVLTAFFDNPDLGVSLDWGLAACPLTYDPPVSDPAELRSPDAQHQLVNLQGVPIAIVTSEASFLGLGDADTVAFLQGAGCDVEHVRLADHGVHGNGHLMMMERNNREALQPILDWLQRYE